MDNNAANGAAAAGMAAGMCFFWIIELALIVLIVAGLWKTFTKAGKPGWAAIVPIYNLIILLEIAEKPLWWILLFLIPCVNLVFSIIVHIEVAKKFGKSAGFGVGLALLGFIFFPILGFGEAKYLGGAGPVVPTGPTGPAA
jgi:hypothetical protein